MKVFIDTNIFLDILCRREQFVDITRNIKDFGFANMEVLDSSAFLGKYK